MRRASGVTLLEATIVLSMMAGLLTLVAMFFVRGQRYTVSTEAYAAVQRQASLLLSQVSSELNRASFQQKVIADSHDEIAVLSSASPRSQSEQPMVEFDEDSGLLVWKKWVAFSFQAGRNELSRIEVPLTPATTDLSTPVAPEVDFPAWRVGPQAQPVGKNVRQFQVHEAPGGVSVSLTVGREMPLPNLTTEQKELFVNVVMEIHMIN